VVGSRPASRASSRTSLRRQASFQGIVPALPLRPGTPAARPGTPARLASSSDVKEEHETPTKPGKGVVAGKQQDELKVADHPAASTTGEKTAEKSDVKPTEGKVEQDKVVPQTPSKVEPIKDPAEAKSVALETPAKAPNSPKVTRKASATYTLQPASKGQATVQTSTAKAEPVTPSKPEIKKEETSKRKHPGKLDITAAVTKGQEATAAASKAAAETPSKTQRPGLASQTPSAISKPESPSVSSPMIKGGFKTLRVVQIPKAETPPPQALATPTLPGIAAGILPSRQPSVASMNVPGTPSSEQVSMSDNISMTSTSLSRANSPPPSKVGSAPVRSKTKSQMKKERQERAKALEEEKAKQDHAVQPVVEDEIQQEAIVSRKKKTKKEKEPKSVPKSKVKDVGGSEGTTPTASRPASPGQKASGAGAQEQAAATAGASATSRTATPTNAPVHGPAPPPTMPPPNEPSPPPTPTLTAAQLLAELKAQAPEIQKCIDSLFRTPTSAHFKPNQPITPQDLQNPAFWKSDFKINLTKDEVDALLNGKIPAVRYGGEDGRIWSRGLVSPTGAHLRALTEELEKRFLELEGWVRELGESGEAGKWKPSKPANEVKFPSIDLEALKRSFENGNGVAGRGVSVMEQMVQDGSTMKKGAFLVDEASKYINGFVMPPATPPPSSQTAGGTAGGGTSAGTKGQEKGSGQAHAMENLMRESVEIVERQVQEARRMAEEREGALKKVIKRNKRVLGLG
jgi:CCR4-NOT transcription complex subunit 4